MPNFIDINQLGRGVRVEIAQSTLVETPNTPELITTTGAGTWTKPEGVTQVLVECWGGGGAGGGAVTPQTGGGGGAGAQYARKTITYPSAQQSISYSVAASVAGNTGNGANGNDTTWDTNVVVAKGGAGGLASSLNEGGGVGSIVGGVGDIVYSGGNGGNGDGGQLGLSDVYGAGGAGGGGAGSNGGANASIGVTEFGGDGGTGGFVLNSSGENGFPGNNYGASGGGAGKVSGANRSGGNGAQGLIRITTYTITGANPPGVPIQMA